MHFAGKSSYWAPSKRDNKNNRNDDIKQQQQAYTRKTSLMRQMVRSFRKLPTSESINEFDTLGGVFTTDGPDDYCSMQQMNTTTETMMMKKQDSDYSLNTVETESSHTSCNYKDLSSSFQNLLSIAEAATASASKPQQTRRTAVTPEAFCRKPSCPPLAASRTPRS